MKKKLLFIFFIIFFICINKTYALQLGDNVGEDGQIVESINSADILVKGNDTKLENFITNKWRTYVKLSDLCSNSLGICEIVSTDDKEISLTKKYENMKDVYYKTLYKYENNLYKSILSVPNSLDFSFGETMTAPDVKPLKIDDELYVPIRFITEALGAEVIYENKDAEQNAKIYIDFYSNMNLDFNVDFYDLSTLRDDDYTTMEIRDFDELKRDGCYDIVANVGSTYMHNPKLFTENDNFIKIDYNDNVQTNICLKDSPKNKSISFVFNYNGVPLIFNVDENNEEATTIDKLYLSGNIDGISKENEVKLTSKYIGEKSDFDNFATLKWQGHSSLAYQKKNYTIKLYEDDGYSSKYKTKINGWSKRNKYCLKANYIDYTQSRNVVSAKLWGEVVNSRKNLNENLKGLTNGGAIDGYPIELYINDEYQGLYTFNTCKDENLFTGANEPQALYGANHFTEDIWFSNEETHSNDLENLEQWDLEYLMDGIDENTMNNSVQEMVDFVYNSSNEEFKKSLNKYLDVDAAIDYMLFMYYINGSDNAAINTLWVTYDGKVWIPSAYDMDATFGLHPMGRKYLSYDYMLPSKNGDTISSNSDMYLWERLLNVYTKEVKNRYKELRKSVLTSSNVINRFKKFINSIPKEEYVKDFNLWDSTTTIDGEKMVTWENDNNNLSLINNELNKITDYITNREEILDERIDSL